MNQKMQKAIDEYLNRQSRKSHPSGKTDSGGRWYPDINECCECCDLVREPSRAYPWSLMIHCRTANHIANLYGIDRNELLKAIKELS